MQTERARSGSLFAPAAVNVVRRDDGCTILSSPLQLEEYGRCLGDWLVHWARAAPDRLFLAERDAAGLWSGVTYAEALASVRSIAAWLLQNNCSIERPVAVLCDNSVRHGLMSLAAMHIGVPVTALSSAYSLISTDYGKLTGIINQVRPGVIFVSEVAPFRRALAAIDSLHDALIVSCETGPEASVTPWSKLLEAADNTAVDAAFRLLGPDSIAKLLFTSGSTGTPKAVITTQRMLLSNQQQIRQVWPFLEHHVPTMVDWLPWSHTFGGSHNFNLVLRSGGTLYIDTGRPVPHRFAQSVANLRDVAPTLYFNVPRGFDMLLPVLRNDAAFRRHFCSRLELMFSAAAALPQHIWEELRQLGSRVAERRIPVVTAWGATETAPLATSCYFEASSSAVIGIPVPGVDLKLVPRGPKLEVRVKGPNVTPGYWKRPDLTSEAFDAEGFYRIGDALKLVDPEHAERGVLFDGRVSEDFKLSSGTWVNVGAIRLRVIGALAPLIQDAVVTGHDRESLGLLLFPNLPACRNFCSALPADATLAQILSDAALRATIRSKLADLRKHGRGSSTFATCALLMLEPPSIDAGEITDKAYINQRVVLDRRQALVAALYSVPPGADVIDIC